MAYTPHTLGATASPASAILAVLDVDILAVTGWTRVETALVSGTLTWNVYKSAAANNAQGADFFIAIGYVTATPTDLVFTCFEQWNTGTKQATNYPPNASVIPTATYANPGTALALPSSGTTMHYMRSEAALAITGFLWGVDVTPNRIDIWLGSSTTQAGYYLGLLESFLNATDDPFPLVCLRTGANAAVNAITSGVTLVGGFATREPKQTVASANNFAAGNSASTGRWTPSDSTTEGYSGRKMVGRHVCAGRGASSFMRGFLRDHVVTGDGSANGDSIVFTLNGVTYTAYRSGGAANISSFIVAT